TRPDPTTDTDQDPDQDTDRDRRGRGGARSVSFLMKDAQGVPCAARLCAARGVCVHNFMLALVRGRPWAYFEEIAAPGSRDVGTSTASTNHAVLTRGALWERNAARDTDSPAVQFQALPAANPVHALVCLRVLSFLSVHDLICAAHWLSSLCLKRNSKGQPKGTLDGTSETTPEPGIEQGSRGSEKVARAGPAVSEWRRCVPHIEVYSLRRPLHSTLPLDVTLPLLYIPHRCDRIALSFEWADQGYGNRKGALVAFYLKRRDAAAGAGEAPGSVRASHECARLVAEERVCERLVPAPPGPVDGWSALLERVSEECGTTDDFWGRHAVLDVSVPAELLGARRVREQVELPPAKVQAADCVLLGFVVGGGGGHGLVFDQFHAVTVRFQVLPAGSGPATRRVLGDARTRERLLAFLPRAAQEPLRRTLSAHGCPSRHLLLARDEILHDVTVLDRVDSDVVTGGRTSFDLV
ncbi:hypothetical protein GNI_190390, partial [Gregarina niphandrodes]